MFKTNVKRFKLQSFGGPSVSNDSNQIQVFQELLSSPVLRFSLHFSVARSIWLWPALCHYLRPLAVSTGRLSQCNHHSNFAHAELPISWSAGDFHSPPHKRKDMRSLVLFLELFN